MNLNNKLNELSFTNATEKLTKSKDSHPAAYVLLNTETEKVYVGSTENLYKRIHNHKTNLLNGEHKNKNLQDSFNNDPLFNLSFIQTKNVEQAINIEQQIIDTFVSDGILLNIATDARLPRKGIKLSEETKEKQIELWNNTEFKNKMLELFKTPEYRQKQSDGVKNPVSIDGTIFGNVAKASRSLSINHNTISKRLNNPKYSKTYFRIPK
jgi:predicted GIY-YIG superfamily endonuclease